MTTSETLGTSFKMTFIVIAKVSDFAILLLDWKCLQIGTLRAKDIRKNVSILQKGGATHFPHTQPAIRVVLLLT